MTVDSGLLLSVLVGGVDMGGTKVRVGLGDTGGMLCGETEFATETAEGLGKHIVSALADLAASSGRGLADIAAIAIGGAGAVGSDGKFVLAPNIPGLADHDLVGAVGSATGVPVLLENDVNIAALAELRDGQTGDFCFVSLGTGVGMGLVVNGRLVRGARGAAGEIGFLPIGKDPLKIANQRRGAFEEVVAAETVSDRYRAATGFAETTPRVFELATEGDAMAIEAVEDYARAVAHGLSAVVAVLDPAEIILGGGVGRRADLLPRITRWLGKLGTGHVQVRITTLGPTGPVLGALHLASDHVLKEGSDR